MNRLFRIAGLAFICILGGAENPANADDDIEWEVVHPFRFFKYESDFEIHRLAYEDLKSRSAPAAPTPTILEMDRLLNNAGWWDEELKPEIVVRYEDPSLNTPRRILTALRHVEIEKQHRPRGLRSLPTGIPDTFRASTIFAGWDGQVCFSRFIKPRPRSGKVN